MKNPVIPPNEKDRLKALKSLNILDTSPEERFDRLTRMAKRMFDVPIALISLIDEDRQWFKSSIGLSARETHRDISFCGHAILGEEILVVPDTYKDERFADNPLVLDGPRIRFYAGCPLKSTDGSNLGTLCIIDHKPRNFSSEDLEGLKDLSLTAERELAAIQLAAMDELTNIPNRRGFMLVAEHSLNLCIRQDITASLVYLDVDKLKSINDTFGHAQGDNVLIRFAEQLNKTCRGSDLVARLGGDEFVILFINTPKTDVEDTILKLQKSLGKENQESNYGYDILFSYGIVEFDPVKHSSVELLLEDGDSLMYEYKNKHR